ncbi:MAG: sulfatase [Planctomycetota bacterium]
MRVMMMAWVILLGCFRASVAGEAPRPPNLVILFADDLGYGDLGCYGHPTIRTPNLDRMAAEGMKFTQFYSADSVCTPSRSALLTGRLPVRTGLYGDERRVFFTYSKAGIPEEEITLAEALKGKGYATACIGKWHLGHLPKYLPTKHGFDLFFGLPYSNDMYAPKRGDPPVPLLRGEKVIEQPVDQSTLTQRYTEEAVQFIEQHREKPFLLYLPYTFPHVPLFVSEKFRGKSPRGLYGDVVEEIDASVGTILDTLRSLGIAENTLVFFTSDNGPWLIKDQEGGSAGLLREGKGCTFEGGMREPCIAWWPGRVKPLSVATDLACTMDIFATGLALAEVTFPRDRILDGTSLLPVLHGKGKSARTSMYYWRGSRLMAVRKGPWKAHFYTQPAYARSMTVTEHQTPLLYQLEQDPSEKYDVALDNPEIVKELRAEAENHKSELQVAKSILDELP